MTLGIQVPDKTLQKSVDRKLMQKCPGSARVSATVRGGDYQLEQRQRSAFTSVALHGVDWKTGTSRYRFVGAISAKDFNDSLFDIA